MKLSLFKLHFPGPMNTTVQMYRCEDLQYKDDDPLGHLIH